MKVFGQKKNLQFLNNANFCMFIVFYFKREASFCQLSKVQLKLKVYQNLAPKDT